MMSESSRRAPETEFGIRLKAARKMAGLSMEDLARKLGGLVTKQAIGKYEQGRMLPSPEVFERLVAVLKDATWGASPLKAEDLPPTRQMALLDEPAFRMYEAAQGGARMAFRRRGLLWRLKKAEPAEPDEKPRAKANLSFLVQFDKISEIALHREMPSAALREEPAADMASPAARRARFLRAWEAGSAPGRIQFRAGERLSAKTAAALKYRIADHLERYLALESLLGARETFENPVAGLPVRTADDVERAAGRVRERWGLGSGPIVNLLGLLEDRGIKVYEARGLEGFEGLSGRFGDLPFVAVSLEFPADRVRFTAAHELGHLMCDLPGTGDGAPAANSAQGRDRDPASTGRGARESDEGPESSCHAFGAALLLPRAALERALTPSRRKVTLGELAEIKETFGISLQAIMYRARALDLVSDRQLRSFRETIKAKGWAVEEPVAYAGKERAARFRRLLHYAVAAGILDVARAAERAGLPAAELEKEIGDIF